MKFKYYACVSAAALLLTACGSNPGDRALSGAGLGAGVGAVGGALVGVNPVTSAVVGAGVGAATGALTREDQINMGRPAWKR